VPEVTQRAGDNKAGKSPRKEIKLVRYAVADQSTRLIPHKKRYRRIRRSAFYCQAGTRNIQEEPHGSNIAWIIMLTVTY
jgi:hypothetical protein